jgi:hypothetical protein
MHRELVLKESGHSVLTPPSRLERCWRHGLAEGFRISGAGGDFDNLSLATKLYQTRWPSGTSREEIGA